MLMQPLDPSQPVDTCARTAVQRSAALALGSLGAGVLAAIVGLSASRIPGLTLPMMAGVGAGLLVVVGGPLLALYLRPPQAMVASFAQKIDATRKEGKPMKVVTTTGIAVTSAAAFVFALVLVFVVLAPELAAAMRSSP